MRSINRRFANLDRRHPGWGLLPCLTMAIRHQGFTPRTISTSFRDLISKDDYAPKEAAAIIRHLRHLTNEPRADKTGANLPADVAKAPETTEGASG